MQRTYDTQLPHLLELHRHVEDLDNRSRRYNIRVRGVPEVIDLAAIEQAICSIFNDLLGHPADSPIEIESPPSIATPTQGFGTPKGCYLLYCELPT